MNDDSTKPEWDQEYADKLLGSFVLVGLTYLDIDGSVSDQTEVFGCIASATRDGGIVIALEGKREGETFTLPPQPNNFHAAALGEYHLRSTGETITDPAYTATWEVRAPKPGGGTGGGASQ